ncbi:MAG: hypothetical protein WC359_13050 [Dehalococcoidia bacterium]|jgi:hypothetical protein
MGERMLGDPPDEPCGCGSSVFWQRADGGFLCAFCHPSWESPRPPTHDLTPTSHNTEEATIAQMAVAWRSVSIKTWRRILIQALNSGDKQSEEYANWMLKDVLNEEEV